MKARSELNRKLDQIERQMKAVRKAVKTQHCGDILAVSDELYADLTETVETFKGWLEGFRTGA